MALAPKAVSPESSACEAGGGDQLPTVIGRKGETESEREKQLKAISASGLPEAGPAIGPERLRATRSPWVSGPSQ